MLSSLQAEGVWGLGRFWAIWSEKPKKRLWSPVEAVSAKFSGDLKVAQGDSANNEPKKNPDFEPFSPSYVQNTASRARWR